jgi:hypothetical protein
MWLEVAACLCCLTLANKHSDYKVERCAQFMVSGLYLEYTKYHSLHTLFLAPFLWYILAGTLIELGHFLHVRKYQDMRENWIKIQSLREQADLAALFKLLLTEQTVDNKYLGIQWKNVLSKHSQENLGAS